MLTVASKRYHTNHSGRSLSNAMIGPLTADSSAFSVDILASKKSGTD
jgi:hypothetical protein